MYGDLDSTLEHCLSFGSLLSTKAQQDIEEKDGTILKLKAEIDHLQLQLINAQNNFQVLFNTAKAEIDRKDAIIKDQQVQLDAFAKKSVQK